MTDLSLLLPLNLGTRYCYVLFLINGNLQNNHLKYVLKVCHMILYYKLLECTGDFRGFEGMSNSNKQNE